MSGEKGEEIISLAGNSSSLKNNEKKFFLAAFIIALAVLSFDQLTKSLITRNLLYNQSFPVIKGIFHLTLIHNKGAAFGILKNQIPLFVAASLVAIFLIYLDLKKNKHRIFYAVSLSLILGGALGNLIDRLSLGYVVDFLDFRIWPVFNVADSAITIGAVLLGWSVLSRNLQ